MEKSSSIFRQNRNAHEPQANPLPSQLHFHSWEIPPPIPGLSIFAVTALFRQLMFAIGKHGMTLIALVHHQSVVLFRIIVVAG